MPHVCPVSRGLSTGPQTDGMIAILNVLVAVPQGKNQHRGQGWSHVGDSVLRPSKKGHRSLLETHGPKLILRISNDANVPFLSIQA